MNIADIVFKKDTIFIDVICAVNRVYPNIDCYILNFRENITYSMIKSYLLNIELGLWTNLPLVVGNTNITIRNIHDIMECYFRTFYPSYKTIDEFPLKCGSIYSTTKNYLLEEPEVVFNSMKEFVSGDDIINNFVGKIFRFIRGAYGEV